MVVGLWAAPAHADLITVDWDVVPHAPGEIGLDETPYYVCSGITYGNRSCYSLWEQGLELGAVLFSFYDDKFYDGTGSDEFEPFFEGDGVFRISPVCKSGLAPCFDTFTPVTLEINGATNGIEAGWPNLFILSSRGGLVKLPGGNGPVNFSGSEWEDLSWLEIGFFKPAECFEHEDEFECRDREQGASVESLTFEAHAVPEPSLIVLIGAGLGAIGRRKYHARMANRADGSHTHTSSF